VGHVREVILKSYTDEVFYMTLCDLELHTRIWHAKPLDSFCISTYTLLHQIIQHAVQIIGLRIRS